MFLRNLEYATKPSKIRTSFGIFILIAAFGEIKLPECCARAKDPIFGASERRVAFFILAAALASKGMTPSTSVS